MSLGTHVSTNYSRLEVEEDVHDHNKESTNCVKQTSLIGVAVAFMFVISGNFKY